MPRVTFATLTGEMGRIAPLHRAILVPVTVDLSITGYSIDGRAGESV